MSINLKSTLEWGAIVIIVMVARRIFNIYFPLEHIAVTYGLLVLIQIRNNLESKK